jgi:hypothetical protein
MLMLQVLSEHSIEWPATGPWEIQAPPLSVRVEIEPAVARRRANGYLGLHVGMALLANNPRLLVRHRPHWRFDIDLQLPQVGKVATLGVVEVDATTGEVTALADSVITELQERADVIATRLAPTAAPAG